MEIGCIEGLYLLWIGREERKGREVVSWLGFLEEKFDGGDECGGQLSDKVGS